MKKLIPLVFVGGALLVGNAEAGTQILWRSSTTGAIAAPPTTQPPETSPPIVTPPSKTLSLSYSGQFNVAVGATVSLLPIVKNGSGQYAFSYFSVLPLGVLLDDAGNLHGRALVPGSYPTTIGVTDKISGIVFVTRFTITVS